MGQISLHCVLLALLVLTTATAQVTNCSNILRGRDGIPGREGRDGRDGLQGPIGPQGPIGVRGEKGHPGEFPGEKGEKGVPGVEGYKGEKGQAGEKGSMGEKGHKGAVGPSGPMGLPGPKGDFRGEKGDRGFSGQKGSKGEAGSGGVTYVRWGRTVCPQGTSTVYTGVAAGTKYDTKGGTSDTLCLAGNPQYKSGEKPSIAYTVQLSGVRNEVGGASAPLVNRYHTYLPCALCHTTTKSTSFMLPGRYTCPSGWNMEYSGYIMSERTQNQRAGRRDTICVDQFAEAASTRSSGNPAMLYLMQVTCIGLDCPPFNSQKPLTCAVCSK